MGADEQHRCDDQCVCPIHGTPLIYWPKGDDHACQDMDCLYARGVAALIIEGYEMVTPLDGSPPYVEPPAKPVTPEEFMRGGSGGE